MTAVLIFSFVPQFVQAKIINLSIKTRDGVILRARYCSPAAGKPVVIMLHGLASVKEEFGPLETFLIGKGWGTLSYDARGHGESSLTKDQQGVADGFKYFGPPGPGSQWDKMIDDVGAVVRYVRVQKKLDAKSIFLCGASLGANVAVNYASITRTMKGVVLLSPGLNYAEIKTEETFLQAKNLPILMVASPRDNYAHESCERLLQINPKATFWDDVKPGHGVQMFDEKLLQRIFDWMQAH